MTNGEEGFHISAVSPTAEWLGRRALRRKSLGPVTGQVAGELPSGESLFRFCAADGLRIKSVRDFGGASGERFPQAIA